MVNTVELEAPILDHKSLMSGHVYTLTTDAHDNTRHSFLNPANIVVLAAASHLIMNNKYLDPLLF